MAGEPLTAEVGPNPPGAFEADPAPVLMAFAGPAKQNRLTVFFRLILAIPQFIVLSVVGIAAEVVLVIGWFGALFMGRLPLFAADFLSGYLRWSARVYAYMALLTDKYPPFTFDDVDYPVRVAVRPGKLNRLAVFFRFVLVIPAWIAASIAGIGLYTIGLLVTWFIVLISGTVPTPLYKAIAAIVRYETRLTGYLLLLTSEYPWGLFGDRPEVGAGAPAGYVPPPAAPGYGEAPPIPGYGEAPPAPGDVDARPAPGYGEAPPAPSYGEAPPAPGYGPPASAPRYGAPAGQNWWRLVLSTREAQLVGLFAAAGVVVWVLYAVFLGTVAFSSGGVVQRAVALSQSKTAYTQLSDATRMFAATSSSCQNSPQVLSCVTGADRQIAQSFGTFDQAIRGISMPSDTSAAAASRLASAAGQAQQVFQRLGASTSVSQYRQTVQSSNLTQLLTQLDQDYQALGQSLTP